MTALRSLLLAGLLAACAHRPPEVDLSRGSVQLKTFETAWVRVGEAWPYEDMSGIDWEGKRAALWLRASRSRSNEETRQILTELLAPFGVSHLGVVAGGPTHWMSQIRTRAVRWLPGEEQPAHSQLTEASAGLGVTRTDDGFLVSRLRPGGPAEIAGIRVGDRVRRVGGLELDTLDELLPQLGLTASKQALLPNHLVEQFQHGPVGSLIHVVTDSPEGPQVYKLHRDAVDAEFGGVMHIEGVLVQVDTARLSDGRVGYVRISDFLPPAVPRVTAAIEGFRADGVAGVILDLRGNGGGLAAIGSGVASHFIKGRGTSLGSTIGRRTQLELIVNPRVSRQRYDGPLAVLIDGSSASTSEIVAGGLSQVGRARLFGETTSGLAMLSLVEPLPNGDLLQHVMGDLSLPDGSTIEGVGIAPDEPTPVTPGIGYDPAIRAATDWILTRSHEP